MAAQAGRAAQADGFEPGQMAHAASIVDVSRTTDTGRDCVPSRDRRADLGHAIAPARRRPLGRAQKRSARSPLQNRSSNAARSACDRGDQLGGVQTSSRTARRYFSGRAAHLHRSAGSHPAESREGEWQRKRRGEPRANREERKELRWESE